MDSSELKTRTDIDALKANWVSDPCWDIEDTKGFELHREELLEFHLKMRVIWDARRARREALEGKRPFIKIEGEYIAVAHITGAIYFGEHTMRVFTDESAASENEGYYTINGNDNVRRFLSWLDAQSYDIANEDE